jgi:predicted negative regulator of RcsB-dependent stress response
MERRPARFTKIGIFLAAVAMVIPAGATAQSGNPASFSSRAQLTIRIRLMNERPPDHPIQVDLLTVSGIAITQTFTHGDGEAVFRDTPEGSYRVKVSGTEYETFTSDAFTILHNEGAHSESFQIKLKPTAAEKPNTLISSGELQVPEKAREQLQRAEKQFESGAADDAIASLRKAIEIYPRYARAYNNLGVALISKGDVSAALDAFHQSVKVDDKFLPGMINLARLELRQQDLAQAQIFAEKALTIQPLNPEALTLLANVQFYQSRYTDAVATVNRIHAVPHEGFAEAHLIAAEAYQKTGNNRQAIEECKLFLKEDPKSPRAEQVRNGIKVLETRK